MSDNRPQATQLDFSRDICARHREPLRAEWPRGAVRLMVALFQAFATDPRIIAAAPKDAEGQADAEAIPRLILEFGPLCCFVGDEAMERLIAEALA